MHEHDENLPKYMLKMPLGANTNTMGHGPIKKKQKKQKIARKVSFPNPFQK